MQEFERLGVFYLGRLHEMESQEDTDELLLYDSKDLTTHAVCVGMTGSGKTGLCIGLLEVCLAWAPFWQSPSGESVPAWE